MARFANIRAITFDAGGTLLEPWPSVGAVYAAVAAEHGWREVNVAQLNANFAAAWRRKTAFDYSTDAWRQIVEASFAGLVDRAAVDEFFDELYARFEDPASWAVYDDVRPALESLRQRAIRLALISNWDLRLRPLLKRVALAEYFDAILISAEVGVAKPSPWIFREAAAQLGVLPGTALHVGDSEHEDVLGARAAGLAAVRIDRRRESSNDHTIPCLTALDSWL
jgi:putative hydrolase of the HAD superfamily